MATEITEYSPTEAGLAEIRSRLQGLVYDVRTTAGMESARKDRRELVRLRTDLEKKRAEIKAPALERCRVIDAEAKRITGEIFAIEAPIDQQIRAEEGRKETEKAERARVEAARIAAITRRIDWIRGQIAALAGKPAVEIKGAIDALATIPLDAEHYAELLPDAVEARTTTVGRLRELHASAIANEIEAARLKAEREELARQRAKQDAANAAERARLAEAERKAKAERDAADAAAKAERDAADAKAREEREAADRVAREKREAEEREIARRKEEVEREERAREDARREAAESALAALTADPRIAEFVELATAYKFAGPGVDSLAALVALCGAYAEGLRTLRAGA